MLFFHLISCSPRTIFGYWKDLLSVTSKASVFSGAIFRHLLSSQRFARHRLSLILSSRIPTSLAAHTTSASFAKPMMLVPAGRSMRRKSSYTMFQTSVSSLERLYVWKQALHNVFESIGIIQARGRSSSHQSLSDYFEGDTA